MATLTTPPPEARVHAGLALVGFILLCNGTGFASGFLANEPEFYAALNRPSFAPPPWVFAPVWTTLYTLMGIAAWLVWRERADARRRTALWLFGIQLALNAAWTPVFFGAHAIAAALAVIVLIDLAVIAMLIAFARVRPVAGYLVVPLALWVGFATALTAAIVVLNR